MPSLRFWRARGRCRRRAATAGAEPECASSGVSIIFCFLILGSANGSPALGGFCALGYNPGIASAGDLALERHRTFIAALGERLLSERERWPLWLPVLMGGGIAIFFMLDQEP